MFSGSTNENYRHYFMAGVKGFDSILWLGLVDMFQKERLELVSTFNINLQFA